MKVLIPLAEGFEEIEAVATIDVLRRAEMDVVTVGLPGTHVKGSRGLNVIADNKMDDINPGEFDALVLVGGDPGHKNLAKSQSVIQAIIDFDKEKKTVAAICASPSILAKAGVLNDRRATIYPGMEREIPRPREGKVIVDGHVITGQAPGAAIDFALTVVEEMLGKEKMLEVKNRLVY